MTEYVIDIHAHILPGIDDGAANWEESRKMLEMAYNQGIHTIIATPHFSRKQSFNQLQELTGKLNEEAKKIYPDFQIYLGQEILYFDSLVDYLKEGKALTLANSRYILVEFMPNVRYHNLYQWVRKILMAGYLPVIAHVERYHTLRKENRLQELAAIGCYLQMNYRSLEGGFFDSNTRWCRRCVLNGDIHFLGTDMHHSSYRTPVIKKSLNWLKHNAELDQMLDLTNKRAGYLIRNQSFT